MSSQLWGFQLNQLKISISYSYGFRLLFGKLLFQILISQKMVASSSFPFLLWTKNTKFHENASIFFLWKFLKRDVRKRAITWCILPRSANIGGTVNSIEMTHWMQISLIFNTPLFLDVNLKYLTVIYENKKHGKNTT